MRGRHGVRKGKLISHEVICDVSPGVLLCSRSWEGISNDSVSVVVGTLPPRMHQISTVSDPQSRSSTGVQEAVGDQSSIVLMLELSTRSRSAKVHPNITHCQVEESVSCNNFQSPCRRSMRIRTRMSFKRKETDPWGPNGREGHSARWSSGRP